MPNKEIEYDVLAALYKYAERWPSESYMDTPDLGTETGLDRDTLISVLLSLELKRWAELFRIPEPIGIADRIVKAKITVEGRLMHEGRRFK